MRAGNWRRTARRRRQLHVCRQPSAMAAQYRVPPLRRHQDLPFVLLAALVVHGGALAVFFHQDDFQLLEGTARAYATHTVGTWLLAPHVDHLLIIQKGLFLAYWRLLGASAVPWHVTMLALHLLNCVLVWRLLARVPIAMEARFLAAVSFAATTVFHECIYWVAASTVPFSLACILATADLSMAKDRRWWHLPAGASLASAAVFSASYGLIAPLLVPLLCHGCAEDAIRPRAIRRGAL